MPQANYIQFDTPSTNWGDLISDKPRRDQSYPYSRSRTYSLPSKPPVHDADGRRDDSDPLARMKLNLERTTFLLSNLKVGVSNKPEAIQILPSLDEDDQEDYYPLKRRYIPPPSRLERSDSNATTNSTTTQLSLEVSNYNYLGPKQDHGSEFHQLINHGRLHNPSREHLQKLGTHKSAAVPPPSKIIVRDFGFQHRPTQHPHHQPDSRRRPPSSNDDAPSSRRERPQKPVKIVSRPMPASFSARLGSHGRSVSMSHDSRVAPPPLRPSKTLAHEPSQFPRRVRFDTQD